MTEKLLHCG